jgi:hypothetical protein
MRGETPVIAVDNEPFELNFVYPGYLKRLEIPIPETVFNVFPIEQADS